MTALDSRIWSDRTLDPRSDDGSEPTVLDPGPRPPSGRHEREVAALAIGLHELRPDVPMPVLEAMIEEAYERLGASRVQGFRMILAERSVRRRLAIGADPDAADQPGDDVGRRP